MAESENKTESIEEAPANPNADILKRMLLRENHHLSNDEDLGSPVVKPTDSSSTDGTKKVNKVSDCI